jgi:MarR-like DNA-binding transcriptional regulator SgrR of sgrS sRNA
MDLSCRRQAAKTYSCTSPRVERTRLSTLNEGQHIEYEIEENRGKTSAVNLKVK